MRKKPRVEAKYLDTFKMLLYFQILLLHSFCPSFEINYLPGWAIYEQFFVHFLVKLSTLVIEQMFIFCQTTTIYYGMVDYVFKKQRSPTKSLQILQTCEKLLIFCVLDWWLLLARLRILSCSLWNCWYIHYK